MLQKIGFIGLGTIGYHMASALVKGGYQVTVFDVDTARMDALTKLGAVAAPTAVEAAAVANWLFQLFLKVRSRGHCSVVKRELWLASSLEPFLLTWEQPRWKQP